MDSFSTGNLFSVAVVVRFIRGQRLVAAGAGGLFGMYNYNGTAAMDIAASMIIIVNQTGVFVVKSIRRVTRVFIN